MLSSDALRVKAFPLSRKQRQFLIVSVLLITDALVLSLTFWLAFQLRFETLPYFAPYDASEYTRLVAWMIPLWLLIFAASQLYNPHYLFGGLEEYARIFNAVTVGVVALIIVGFFSRESLVISRGWLLLSWIPSIATLIVSRFLIRRAVYVLRRRGHFLTPALIIGVNHEARALAEQLKSWTTSGLYLVGFVDGWEPVGKHVSNGYKVLGQLGDIERVVKELKVEEIIIVPTALTREKLLEVFRKFNTQQGINIHIASGLFDIFTTGLRVKELAHVPLIDVSKARISGVNAIMKMIMEYSLTILGLLLILPWLLLIVIAIRLDSPGPVIYRRRVMGGRNEAFDAFKFRTMYENGDEILAAHPELKAALEQEYKLKEDPRVTRVGHFLRRYSLDELPQLFNVLLGQMSLIGPRMISPPEMQKYGEWGLNLLTVKPGITGMWQVSGRSDVTYQERVRMDMYYIRNWSLWLDIFILLRTFAVVFRGHGAY